MAKWQCIECGYFFDGAKPPDKCPGCAGSCTYADVTCYRPECGGPVNPDPMVMGMITKRVGLAAPLRPTAPEKTQEPIYVEKVTKNALLQGLTDDEISRVLNLGHTKIYNPGDTVFNEGDEALRIYIVDDGKLAIQTPEKQSIYHAVTGDILGWSSLMLPYKRTASAIAETKARVIVLDQQKLQDFCEKNASIGYKITRNVGRIIAMRMRTSKAMPADVVYG